MPQRYWRHSCPCYDVPTSTTRPVCPTCGRKGKYDGWGGTGFVEGVHRYIQRCGLKPLFMREGGWGGEGPAELLRLLEKCSVCEGSGVIDHGESSTDFQECLSCGGTGAVRTVSDEEFLAVRQKFLERCPDAEHPDWTLLPNLRPSERDGSHE